jgi:hypothetical protein
MEIHCGQPQGLPFDDSLICIAGSHKGCPYALTASMQSMVRRCGQPQGLPLRIDHVDAIDDSLICIADQRVEVPLVGTRADRSSTIH